jgi:hypothetical protein
MAVEPLAREGEFGLLEAVAGVAPFEGHVGAGVFEKDGEPLGAVLRDHAVVAAGEEEDRCLVELRRLRGFEGQHGAEEDGSGESVRAEKKHRGGDVGTVGVADGDDFPEVLPGGLVRNEVGQFVRAADEVVLVEDAGSEAAEEAGLAVFEDLSARAEQGGAGAEELSEWKEIVLVAAGAVEKEKRGGGAGVDDEVHSFGSGPSRRLGSVFSIW